MLQGFSCTGKLPEMAVPKEDIRVIVPVDFRSKSLFLHGDRMQKIADAQTYRNWTYKMNDSMPFCYLPCVEGYPHRLTLSESSWVDVHPVNKPSVWVLASLKGHQFTIEGHLSNAAIGLGNRDQMKTASINRVREIGFWILIIGVEEVFPVSDETRATILPMHTYAHNN